MFDIKYFFPFIGEFEQADPSILRESLCFQQAFFRSFKNHVVSVALLISMAFAIGDSGIAQEINFPEVEEDM